MKGSLGFDALAIFELTHDFTIMTALQLAFWKIPWASSNSGLYGRTAIAAIGAAK
jgi:hypothetical protein